MMARSSKSQEENQRSSQNCSRRRQTLAMAHRVVGVVGGDARGGGTPSRSELGSRLAGLLVRRSFPPLPLPNLTASITPSALS